jgi:hypothetical protein
MTARIDGSATEADLDAVSGDYAALVASCLAKSRAGEPLVAWVEAPLALTTQALPLTFAVHSRRMNASESLITYDRPW